MAQGIQGQSLSPAAALVAVVWAGTVAFSAVDDRSPVLVAYSFDEETLAAGPDTFAVFEHAHGSVHLSPEFRVCGYRSVEIRDVPYDHAFPELQGYFPLRKSGRLYVHFALLTADPQQSLNIALAGPQWFSMQKDGIGLWLKTRNGFLYHVSDSMPKKLLLMRPFTWYLVDATYDVGAGIYELAIREEGSREPLVSLAAQKNATSQPGSAVDKFSFIGDTGEDTSSV